MATYLGPSRDLYANERPMVSCTVSLAQGRSGIDGLLVYMLPVELKLSCETIEVGRKVVTEVPAKNTHLGHVSNKMCCRLTVFADRHRVYGHKDGSRPGISITPTNTMVVEVCGKMKKGLLHQL